MKSRTSCYDPAFSRMELRRFAPAWILYTLILLLSIALFAADRVSYGGQMLINVQSHINLMALLNFGYALLMAQLLFGDLYSARLCYAIHSMPITRGGWFGTQIILGLFGSLIPNCIGAGVFFLLVPDFRIVVLWWLAAVELQFLFFFGAAVLSAVAAGNRLGMAMLYAMINFFYVAVAWMWLKVFTPLIYAMYLPDVGMEFCPVWEMMKNPVFQIQRSDAILESGFVREEPVVTSVSLTGRFWLVAAYATVGCVLIWLAMRIYRRRKLECAGELLAFPRMQMPILLLFTLCAGAAGHLFAYILRPVDTLEYLFLFLGLAVGYFACLMLQKRQVNVFRWHLIAPLACVCVAMLVALTLTGLDVFGLTYRVPEAEKVASVSVGTMYTENKRYVATDPAEIEQVIGVQLDALEEHRKAEADRPLMERIFGSEEREPVYLRENGESEYSSLLFIIYAMKDGSEMKRCYFVHESSPGVPALKKMLSSPEVVFSNYDETYLGDGKDLNSLLERIEGIQISCSHEINEFGQSRNYSITSPEDIRTLMEAILADCETGAMAQPYFLHESGYYVDNIHVGIRSGGVFGDTYRPYARYVYLGLFKECENTYNWLVEHGCHEEITEDTFKAPDEDELIKVYG